MVLYTRLQCPISKGLSHHHYIRITTKARSGQITDQELEKEKGGTGLRYSFDILSNHVNYEVGVDAKTGKVLENTQAGKNPD